MAKSTSKRAPLVVVTALVGGLVAGVLALLTFGAQASAGPDGVPVAVAVADDPTSAGLRAAIGAVEARAGDRLDVEVTTPDKARGLLHDKEVYGVLELSAGPGGPQVTVVTSGAVNPAGTQVAQQALTGAGQAVLAAAARNAGADAEPIQVERIHPVGTSMRAIPVALSALAWLGCLVAGATLTLLAQRGRVRIGAAGRLAGMGVTSVFVTAVLAGLVLLWDSSLPLGWDVIGLLALVTLAFAAVQGGLLHLLGIKAMAVLAPLYLTASVVAAQVPELLHPGYRVALWSWSPFRFPSEALRSLLAGTSDVPDVTFAVWVLTGILVGGLLLLAVPRRSAGQQAETHPADRIVDVGVDKADRLPGPQHELATEYGDRRVRR
ncbi:ABC transporter permease [Haloechinothrix salitolerans]